MATVAKNTRSTTVVLGSNSAGPFALTFRLFDTDGVKVYVDGIASTAWTLAATFTDGFDDAATITFDAPVISGSTIIIDAALVPWRADDLINGDQNLGARLNVELARIWATLSELRRDSDRSLRSFTAADPTAALDFDILTSAQSFAVAASGSATAASGSASAAAASAVAAQAAENSLLEWKGPWVTATAYAPSDIVSQGGASYVCIVAHTSGTFATDVAAAKWQVMAEKGAAGAGTGDMLKSENLSGLANYTMARTNLGLGAMATKATVAFADMTGAAVVTSGETIAANNNNTTLPTSAAVKAYVDASIPAAASEQFLHVRDEKAAGQTGGTFTEGSFLTRALTGVVYNNIPGASLSANRITLPVGNYRIIASAPACSVGRHRAILYNVTAGSVALLGTTESSPQNSNGLSRSVVNGRFGLLATSALEIRHRCEVSRAANGFGNGRDLGLNEIYTDVMIWKI